MKKIAVIISILLFTLNGFSQQSTNIVTLKTGIVDAYTALHWDIDRSIKDGTDTTVYFALIYQNSAYQYIVDQSINIIISRDELQNFCNKLIDFGDKTYEGTYSETVSNIQFYISGKYVHLVDKDGKRVLVPKKKIAKLGWDILENINLLK